MSGAGGNAFSDLLRAVLGERVGFAWIAIGAAALSAFAALVAAWVATRILAAFERRFGVANQAPGDERASLGGPAGDLAVDLAGGRIATAVAWGGAFGALALWPVAPHVYFADHPRGAFAMLGLLLVAATAPVLGTVLGDGPGSTPSGDAARAHRVSESVAGACAAALAIAAGLLVVGSGNLIEASRAQGRWWGLGWSACTDVFALLALLAFVAARAEGVGRRGAGIFTAERPKAFTAERVGAFAWSLLGASVFLGGFESPLTFLLRRTLGEDPGFLNHQALPGGGTATHVDWGGFLFQALAAATLLLKAALIELACARLAARRDASRTRPWARRLATSWSARFGLAVLGLCGAGGAAWAREALARSVER